MGQTWNLERGDGLNGHLTCAAPFTCGSRYLSSRTVYVCPIPARWRVQQVLTGLPWGPETTRGSGARRAGVEEARRSADVSCGNMMLRVVTFRVLCRHGAERVRKLTIAHESIGAPRSDWSHHICTCILPCETLLAGKYSRVVR